MRTAVTAIIAVSVLLASHGRSMAFSKVFTVAHWSAIAYFNDKNKQLEYCSASSTNKDGMTIAYAVDRRFVWKLAFSSPAWDLMVGHTINITLKVGEEQY